MNGNNAALTAATVEATVDRLIENGTFGTPGARSLSSRTPDEVARTIKQAFENAPLAGRDVIVPQGSYARATKITATGISSNSSPDDLDLVVHAAIDGDRGATQEILTRIRPLIVRYCRARLHRQENTFAYADDVAQESCLAVLTALPAYKHQDRPFLAFVYGIASHKVANAHRATAHNPTEPVPEDPDVPDDAGPGETVGLAELARKMNVLLNYLPKKEREVVVLRIFVGLSVLETAEAIGTTPHAVRVTQHRALARLRSDLPPNG